MIYEIFYRNKYPVGIVIDNFLTLYLEERFLLPIMGISQERHLIQKLNRASIHLTRLYFFLINSYLFFHMFPSQGSCILSNILTPDHLHHTTTINKCFPDPILDFSVNAYTLGQYIIKHMFYIMCLVMV